MFTPTKDNMLFIIGARYCLSSLKRIAVNIFSFVGWKKIVSIRKVIQFQRYRSVSSSLYSSLDFTIFSREWLLKRYN